MQELKVAVRFEAFVNHFSQGNDVRVFFLDVSSKCKLQTTIVRSDSPGEAS